jgi:predicted RNA-binding protein with PIN domain
VTVYFVRQGSSADTAIEVRLERLGKQAKNWIVVSSDGRVQSSARAAHASALSSEEFALEMSKAQASSTSTLKHTATLAPEEVEEWLKFFDRKRG